MAMVLKDFAAERERLEREELEQKAKEDKELLAQFAAAALTGLMAYNPEDLKKAHIETIFNIAQAMLAEFKQRTEQKGNGND